MDLVMLLMLSAQPQVVDKRRVAVFELELAAVPERTGRVVSDALVSELRKLAKTSVVSMDEIRTMLAYEADKQALGCDDSCVSEIADALGVDEIVFGGLAALNGESVLTLRRFDQREAKPLGDFTERMVPANGEEFLAALGPAVEELYKDVPLRAGQTRGVPKERGRLLNPPPIPSWATGALAASTVAALVVGASFGLAAVSASDEIKKTEALDGRAAIALQQNAQNTALLADIGYLSALGFGIATAALVPLTDWTGAAE